jgi:hypothetical protein
MRVKRGLAEMLKGGVIMDVVTPEQAKIAEDAGACAVMALERVPADIRRDGGVARMSDPEMIEGIQAMVSIPVMAKVRIGHFVEAQILQSLGVDFIDESEVLTPADEAHHIDKFNFTVPFVCGATNLGEALRRISEGACMIRSKGEAGTGNIVEAVRHLRSIIGDGSVQMGAVGESAEVVPVSVETGEVFIHIQPLLPTNLPRQAALRFSTCGNYEVLDLINYEGPQCTFTRKEAALVLNGMVLTVEAKSKFDSLESFHRQMSEVAIRDYFAMEHRSILFQREDVEFEVSYTPEPFGVQTEAIDGRTVSRPVFESDQIDVRSLPFVTGLVPQSRPFFPWETMEICWYPEYSSIIGSRGLPGEKAYSARQEDIKVKNEPTEP